MFIEKERLIWQEKQILVSWFSRSQQTNPYRRSCLFDHIVKTALVKFEKLNLWLPVEQLDLLRLWIRRSFHARLSCPHTETITCTYWINSYYHMTQSTKVFSINATALTKQTTCQQLVWWCYVGELQQHKMQSAQASLTQPALLYGQSG